VTRSNSLILMMPLLLITITSRGLSDTRDLTEPYKKWLEEEVAYIISPVEKDVFLKLRSDRERDLFIAAFWNHRDPIPSTDENEFRDEHYRRIEYANQYFGKGIPKPGWKTDRGRIYIILGDPDDVQTFDTKTDIYPVETWFYQNIENRGLPPAFQLMFFQDKGQGEYRLYNPINHGPQALLTTFEEDPTDYISAYEKMKMIEPSLADASLTLIPGEKPVFYGRPNMSSARLLNEIETVPQKHINDTYARKYLEYKDTVGVEYSTNYIENSSLVKTKKGPNGLDFIQYVMEPQRLSVDNYQDKYYTTLELYGTVTDVQDRFIYQFEKKIPLEFSETQINQIKNRPFNVMDVFPIIPGRFKISVLMKNTTSKEFTSLERTVFIPGPENAIQMTSLMLAYEIKKDKAEINLIRPFQIRDYQLYLPVNRTFVKDGLLVTAFQIHGLDNAERNTYKLKYQFLKNGAPPIEFIKDITEYQERPLFTEKISLKNFTPDHYKLRVSLLNGQTEMVSSEEEFDISHSESIPRPWYYFLRLTEEEDPAFAYTLGLQYFNSGYLEKALPKFKKAYEGKNDSEEIALNLARIYTATKNFKPVISLLSPYINNEEPPKQTTYFLLALSYNKLEKFEEAVRIYKKALSAYTASPKFLNPMGECLLQLGKKKEALETWEKSLKINPDQPEIKEKIKTLNNK
jgi:GWxTD domain-containing protein